MAKRNRKKSREYGFGNIISVRRGIDGAFDQGTVVGDALPVLLGGVTVLGTTWLVRKMLTSSPAVQQAAVAEATGAPAVQGFGSIGASLVANAPLVGIAAGLLGGLGLVYGMGKRTAGTAMMASAATVGGALYASSRISGIAGFGAIVPEYSGISAVMPQMNGLGATVLEPWPAGHRPDSIGSLGDAYGTSIDVAGMGSVNTSAFGTPGFAS